ncbi:protein RRP5 homolog [Vanessa cardui]|uniref:protein RRP5 homolog n=1 Tax=Vanessa cardui TaxID=171605 RepID=UPI001F141ED4|nr:protein RRP5 homolog [Vanessa cardui]
MADIEEYFPRGGKKPTTTYFKQSENFLGAAEKGDKKKKKIKKKTEDDDGYLSDDVHAEIDQSYKNCGIYLNYKVVKEGLLILGRVRQVLETKVNISLPCRMQGVVMACHISEAYNKLLESYVNDQVDQVRELPQMFRPGQYVVTKVLEVTSNHLMLTMMPQHVNSGRMLADLHKGALIQAAVSSVEDHGFVMDIGIPNTRAFLPKDSTNPEVELDTGSLTWVMIKSISSTAENSVITLSNELSALQNSFQRNKTNILLPATAFDFVVDKPLDNGIEGHVLDKTTAYIQRPHVDMVKGKKPALGQKIRARLLYAVPPKKTPFLTMKGIFDTTYPDMAEEQKLQEGDIIEEAIVLKVTGRLIHFKLGEGSLGILSLRRVAVDEDLTDEQVLTRSYPIGSTHRVRVLSYSLADYVYSVSDAPAVLAASPFRLDELSVGQTVTATVAVIADDHLRLSIGRVTGYVPQTHMTDMGVFVDPKKASNSKLPKKKFKVGQEVKARVLSLDLAKQYLVLTLKPTLLDERLKTLTSYEDAVVGRAYTGVVSHIRDYLLVSFFNNTNAYVPKRFVSAQPLNNLTDAFHLGQIVKCTIMSVNPTAKKMSGSLTQAPFNPAELKKKAKKRKKEEEKNKNLAKKKKSNKNDDENASTEANEMDVDESQETGKNKKKKKKKADRITEEMDSTDTKTTDTVDVETKKRKKKNKDKIDSKEDDTSTSSNTNEDAATESVSKKKSKKEKKKADKEDIEASEESDPIETDFQEDSDQVLSPNDLSLLDLSNCKTAKNYKKRVVALLNCINARTKSLEKIEKKIVNMETKGLTGKNKKYHTAMHAEKLVTEERLKKFMEVLKTAQEKLKDFDVKDNTKKKKLEKVIAPKITEDKQKDVKEKNETKDRNIKNVLGNLKPVLDAPSAKDFWSTSEVAAETREESSSSDEEEQEKPKKKRKKLTIAEKNAKAREEEERIRELEKRAIESENAPRSSDQFERALLAEPNCSQLWIAYMAFHLQATEIDKARAVGRKALNTINFREEGEKLNVWLALLNLEHRFGTKESQQKTLEDALQMNDTYQIHSKLLDILLDTSKHQELVSLTELMIRKYRKQPEVYRVCGEACYKAGLVDKARHVMQKGIAALEKKEHVSLLVRFAQLERSGGDLERCEALFEQVLAVYPQRVDVCAAYVDALRAAGDVARLRQVMERMTSQKLPARKMKVLFKKWIEVEEKIGDKEHIESIRQRALDFIKKAKF